MWKDDRGITLVEMIIAIAVSAIVLGAATLFIRNALKSYKLAEDTIDLQIEAQRLAEQLATWVMEGNYVDTVQDSESHDEVFVIYHIPREIPENPTLPAGREKSDLIGKRWIRAFKCDGNGLYMYKDEGSALDPSDVKVKGLKCNDYSQSLLSEYVEGLTVTISKGIKAAGGSRETDDSEEAGGNEVSSYKVTVTLSMKAGKQEYKFTDEINMRNAAYILNDSLESEEEEPGGP